MIRLNDEKFHTFRIYTKHLVTFFPALKSDKNAISRIDTATDALMGSYVKIKKNTGWLKRNLIHSCQFSRNDGHPYVNIRLVDDMLPFLVGISGWFSAPKIKNIRHFKKDNHFKLYAYFYSHLCRGNMGEVPLSEVRELLSIKKDQYKLVGHLKSRLLDPSIALINRTTDIEVTHSPYEPSRKVASFIFDIHKAAAPPRLSPIPPSTSISEASTPLGKKYQPIGIKEMEFTYPRKHDTSWYSLKQFEQPRKTKKPVNQWSTSFLKRYAR